MKRLHTVFLKPNEFFFFELGGELQVGGVRERESTTAFNAHDRHVKSAHLDYAEK